MRNPGGRSGAVLVSAVIPTRNRRALLEQALSSALGQVGVAVEALVVDEGSSDGTSEWLAGIADPRVEVIRHDEPRGVAAARNAAITRASGEWVAFLDDDDLWAPVKARDQVELAERAAASLVVSAMVGIDGRGDVTKLIAAPDPARLAERLLLTNAIGAPSCTLVRTEALRSVGGFDTRLAALADWDLWLRLVPRLYVASASEPLAAYREHATNMMITDAERIEAEFELMRAKHGRAAAVAGLRFGRHWRARWEATRALAAGNRARAAAGYLRRAALDRSPRYAAAGVMLALGPRAERAARRFAARSARRPDWLEDFR